MARWSGGARPSCGRATSCAATAQGRSTTSPSRDDKQWFFHRDSLVAYAVLGGVCLVSPDPIGPFSERAHVWDSFRRFVDRNGWGLGVMAAAEAWLPTYQASGMRFVYIGDEAVVDLSQFSLEGGKMKGLRQAVNRVARYGYTVRFLDPANLGLDDAARWPS